MNSYKYILIFILLILFSCVSPQPVYRLYPTTDEGEWRNGKQYISLFKDEIKISAAIVEYSTMKFTSNIEISNQSKRKILIEPSQFYYIKNLKDKTKATPDQIYAIDPEKRVKEIDLEISKKNADFKSEQQADAAVGCLSAGGNIAGLISGASNDELIDIEEHKSEMERKEAKHNQTINKLNEEKRFFLDKALGKTTLLPSSSINGYIVFPFTKEEGYINLLFIIDRTKFEFNFLQKEEKVIRREIQILIKCSNNWLQHDACSRW